VKPANQTHCVHVSVSGQYNNASYTLWNPLIKHIVCIHCKQSSIAIKSNCIKWQTTLTATWSSTPSNSTMCLPSYLTMHSTVYISINVYDSITNLLFKTGISCRLSCWQLDRATAGESINIESRAFSVCGIASSMAQMGGMHVGKGKGYNQMRAADAMPSQHDFGSYILILMMPFLIC